MVVVIAWILAHCFEISFFIMGIVICVRLKKIIKRQRNYPTETDKRIENIERNLYAIAKEVERERIRKG